jgi:hypothetical protein
MNKINLFSLLVVVGVLANLAFSMPQQRVERSPYDEDEDEGEGEDEDEEEAQEEAQEDGMKLQIALRGMKALGLPQKCISKCHFSTDIGRYNIIDIISYHYITFSRILIFLYHFLKGDIFLI